MAAKDAPLAAPTMAAEDAPPAAPLTMATEEAAPTAPTLPAEDAPPAVLTMTTEDAPAPPAAPTLADAPPAAPAKTQEEVQAEAVDRMRDIGKRLGTIPEDDGELLQLLEEAEFCLSRLDSLSESMHNALRPTMVALVTNELLEHPNPNVSVGITSCLTEVTRLTAPDAPYDDSVMKVVFQRIVDTFGDLDNTNSPSFVRRHSILHTFARVRCCILMLDLELNQMILDMFRHFFKAASAKHSEHASHCMEYIMMFVIEESDDVRPELASCLLQNLTNHAKETLPASFRLAESVLGLCKDRLKPVLHELLKDTPLDEYSNVVTMLFQDTSDAGENNVDASGKDMAAESKLSEKSISDVSPQEIPKVDQKGTSPSITPTTAFSNGAAPVDNVKSPERQDSSKQKQELTSLDKHEKISEQLISCDKEVREPVTVETKKLSNSGRRATRQLNKDAGKSLSIKAAEGLSGKKQHKTSMKLQKEDAVSEKDTDEDINLKEMVSQTRIDNSKFQQEDSRASSKSKRLHEAQEIPLSKKTKMLDENLVGSRIKVWWPDDKMFYPGVVSSYDVSSNMHKVSYDDGDVEVLMLEKERYEFIAEKQDTDPDASSNMRCGRRAHGCQQIKEGKMGTPQSDVKNPPKKRGRPKGVRSNNGVKSSETIVGSKISVLSTKRKPEESAGETSEEKASAKTTGRKKRRRKNHN